MDRRDFLRGGVAALAGTGLGSRLGAAAASGTPDRVSVGILGPGSRGQELLRQLLRVPGVEIVAACDVYEPRFAAVDQLAGRAVARYADYRPFLDRKDLDAIVVATPLYLHAEHVTAALRSGRPVYGEKSMGFTPEDCQRIVQTVKESGQILQVGHQYRYSRWFQQAVARARGGKVGKVTHMVAYWHRDNDWRRPVPDPQLERLINWRLYRDFSGGLLTELGSHHIDVANWVFGEQPHEVMGMGSIAAYNDGREVDDNVQVVFGYSEGRRLLFSSLTDNSLMGEQLWIFGAEGSLQVTLEDATEYYEPKKVQPVSEHSEVLQRGITTGASYRALNEMPYRGQGTLLAVDEHEDPTLTACRSFIECVRHKSHPVADAQVGYASAISAAYANIAIRSGHKEQIPLMAP